MWKFNEYNTDGRYVACHRGWPCWCRMQWDADASIHLAKSVRSALEELLATTQQLLGREEVTWEELKETQTAIIRGAEEAAKPQEQRDLKEIMDEKRSTMQMRDFLARSRRERENPAPAPTRPSLDELGEAAFAPVPESEQEKEWEEVKLPSVVTWIGGERSA